MSGHREGSDMYIKHPRRNFYVMQTVILNKKVAAAVMSISFVLFLLKLKYISTGRYRQCFAKNERCSGSLIWPQVSGTILSNPHLNIFQQHVQSLQGIIRISYSMCNCVQTTHPKHIHICLYSVASGSEI